MVLSNEEIKKLISQPKNEQLIKEAVYHEQRLCFHSEESLSYKDLNKYKDGFLNLVKAFLNEEKMQRFVEALSFPLVSTPLIDGIKDQYSKVFDAKDKFFSIKCSNDEKTETFTQYLSRVNEEAFWEDECFDTLFGEVNTLVVVDRPPNGGDPYFYTLPFESVVDIEVKDSKIEYLLFKETEDSFIFIDSEKHVRIVKIEDGRNPVRYEIDSSVPHLFGYAPVNFLWQEGISRRKSYIKRSGITSVLSLLDDFVIKHNNNKNLGWASAYPPMWKYEEDDDEQEIKQAILNEVEATIEDPVMAGRVVDGIWAKRRNKNLIGTGTTFTIPVPTESQEPDLRNPLGYIQVPIDSLEYNDNALRQIERDIYFKATGRPIEQEIADRPVADQIQSQYEGEKNVLLWVSKQLSNSRQWLVKTLGKGLLDEEIECYVSFGSEFFIDDEKSQIQNLNEYKKAGASQGQIGQRMDSLLQVSSKNGYMRNRLTMLSDLEPFRIHGDDKVTEWVKSSLINPEDFLVKINFVDYVARFERENGSILTYEITKPYKQRIELIKDKIYGYAKADKVRDTGDGGLATGLQQGGSISDRNLEARQGRER